jgi:hypothetical protein
MKKFSTIYNLQCHKSVLENDISDSKFEIGKTFGHLINQIFPLRKESGLRRGFFKNKNKQRSLILFILRTFVQIRNLVFWFAAQCKCTSNISEIGAAFICSVQVGSLSLRHIA